MSTNQFDLKDTEIAWCPGCGHFAMHRILKAALAELKLEPQKLVIVSGIGQAAKLPQYTKCHMFNGLHGRALPPALAINAANPELKVIVVSGDGCSYGEGGNHFIHQILRNPDVTQIVQNNQIYGLTKGQGSPTSMKGMKTTVQFEGVTNEPFNPLAIAISLGATFVARIFVGDFEHAKIVVKKAIQHKGYALIDSLSPCVSFNKFNTYQWYKENSYNLEDDYNPSDQKAALSRAMEMEKFPLGIIYEDKSKPLFWEVNPGYQKSREPLYKREVDAQKLKTLIESHRTI